MTVREHLEFVCEIKDKAPEKIDADIEWTLNKISLNKVGDRQVKYLSGGMKRKLSLGMALVGDSKLIILDEPTSGLDVDSRTQVWKLLKDIKGETAVILSTQYIEEADVLADRICILSHGKVIALDSPLNIKTKYGVGYTMIVEYKDTYGSFAVRDELTAS